MPMLASRQRSAPQTRFRHVFIPKLPAIVINLCPFFQVKVLCQLLTASFIDQVAVRKDLIEEATGNKLSTSKGVPYRAVGIEEDVFIHPSSVMFSASPPQYLVYHEVVRSNQVWLKGEGSLNHLEVQN